jgi:ELWxxDGT repeat protein
VFTVIVSDGTAAGTRRLSEVAPGFTRSPFLSQMKSLGDAAYFLDQSFGQTTADLWRTDGTAEGTRLVKRLHGVNPRIDFREMLGGADGVMFFRIADAAGLELWRTDGTADGTFRVADVNPGPGDSFPDSVSFSGGRVYFAAADPQHGSELWSAPLHQARPPAAVVGRHVFYNNSFADGNDRAASAADDAAIAPDKAALAPGALSTFANVTSYSRGINGVMIDVAGLPEDAGPLTADDFLFRATHEATPAVFGIAPPPTSVTVRRGDGADGSDRITLTWRDYNPADLSALAQAVANGWLEVTLRATPRTGLAAKDVFSFGNLVGETTGGTESLRVNALDLGAVKKALNGTATLASAVDVNRDGRINALDLGVVKQNLNRSLKLIFGPAAALKSDTRDDDASRDLNPLLA